MPPVWLYGVVLLAGLAGLLQLTRPGPARLGWLLALTGLAGGYLIARARVTPLGPDPSVAGQLPGWPGSATALIGAGVLMSVAVAGARLRARLTTTDFGWRQPLAVVLAAAAGLVPLIAAEQWVSNGTGGLLRAGATEAMPAFVIAEAAAHDQPRTVVLRPGAGDTVAYSLLRDRSPQLGDADLPPDPGYVRIVDTAVAELAGGLGQRAATDLAHAGIRFVLLPSADASLGQRIAGAGGLVPQNTNAGWQVWRVQQDAGRLAIAVRGDDAWQVPTSITTVRGRTPVVHVPYAAGTRLLALAEAPSPAWRALIGSRNGHGGTSLPRTTAAGLQAFTLPPTAADVVVSRLPDRRADWLTFQLIALGVVLLAAIPGGRRANEQQQLRHDERLKTALPVGAVA
ncbi:MAG: hypothetical protein QOJ62_734, partial [Actinomycetota bacterium]|nr:hypothetical protein [Actinomycetota bacterium]